LRFQFLGKESGSVIAIHARNSGRRQHLSGNSGGKVFDKSIAKAAE